MAGISASLYDAWAPTYPPTAHNALMAAEARAVTRQLRQVRAESALDVGSGSGRCVPLLARTGATRIAAVDASAGMLARHAGAWRIRADAHHLPFADGAFDLVHASLVAGDIPALTPWIVEMARVLAPGGTLLYSDFHPDWRARGWRRSFTAADGRVVELPLHAHAPDDHRAAWRAAGLTVAARADVIAHARTLTSWWRRRPVAAVVFRTHKAGS